jgi:hypothetical protein
MFFRNTFELNALEMLKYLCNIFKINLNRPVDFSAFLFINSTLCMFAGAQLDLFNNKTKFNIII